MVAQRKCGLLKRLEIRFLPAKREAMTKFIHRNMKQLNCQVGQIDKFPHEMNIAVII
jgi:hypothetical protein